MAGSDLRRAFVIVSLVVLASFLAGCTSPGAVSPVGEAEAAHAGFRCPEGEYVVGFKADGGPLCAVVPQARAPTRAPAGDITGLVDTDHLADGAVTGDKLAAGSVAFEHLADPNYFQPRVTGACTGHTYMQTVTSDGGVLCGEPDIWRPTTGCTGQEYVQDYDANGAAICAQPLPPSTSAYDPASTVLIQNGGTATTYNIPAVGGTIPLLGTANAWTAHQRINAGIGMPVKQVAPNDDRIGPRDSVVFTNGRQVVLPCQTGHDVAEVGKLVFVRGPGSVWLCQANERFESGWGSITLHDATSSTASGRAGEIGSVLLVKIDPTQQPDGTILSWRIVMTGGRVT